jgi:GNAT superfamily N-acetyltransferase
MASRIRSSPLFIREAHANEMPVVRELFREYARSLNLDLSYQDFEEELATLPGKYAPPAGRLLLALDGERAAGCIALRPLDETTCEIKRLFVRPAHRGLGLGEALIARLLDEARKIGASKEKSLESGHVPGYQRVVLDTVYPLMSAAVAMYKRIGFREIPPYCPNPMRGALYMEFRL